MLPPEHPDVAVVCQLQPLCSPPLCKIESIDPDSQLVITPN